MPGLRARGVLPGLTTRSEASAGARRGPTGPQAPLYVLTGERGAGKSTVCARVAQEAARLGLAVAGILTERSHSAEPGAARTVTDLRTGESRPFGFQDRRPEPTNPHTAGDVRSPVDNAATLTGATAAPVDATVASDPLTPGWRFDSEVFAWANQALAGSVPCDLLVVDEIGPLELHGGRGWAGALEVLSATGYRAALVVCRPELIAQLQKRLSPHSLEIFEVTPETRDLLPGAIIARLSACR